MQSPTATRSILKTFVIGVLCAGATMSDAHAQSRGLVASAKENPIAIYKAPSDAAPSGKVPVTDLPWTILDEAPEGFFLVQISGKRAWIDAMDVTANRSSSNRCSKGPAKTDIAGQPGAANDTCK